nr:MAG TPA_asm: hypothetical protein [Caudoviricetes sp.]
MAIIIDILPLIVFVMVLIIVSYIIADIEEK